MTYILDAAHIFTFFFIMLGPVKLIVPFAHATRFLSEPELRRLSLRSVILGALIGVAGIYAGCFLLEKWTIAPEVLMLAAGIILFLVALRIVMPPQGQPAHAEEKSQAAPKAMQIVFPMILTPYGLAVAIVLMAGSGDVNRTCLILGLLLVNMLLNLLAMIFVRPILRAITPAGMQITFSVLGVLMVALGLQIVLASLTRLHILPIVG